VRFSKDDKKRLMAHQDYDAVNAEENEEFDELIARDIAKQLLIHSGTQRIFRIGRAVLRPHACSLAYICCFIRVC